MLLTRLMRPDLPFMLHVRAAAHQGAAREVVESVRTGFAGVSLEHVSVALGYPRPDKTYQKPANWAVSHLTQEHYDYVMSDVDLPLHILRRVVGVPETASVASILDEVDEKAPIYREIFEPAILSLAGAHKVGMPLHLPTLSVMKTEMMREIAEASTLLLSEPEFIGHEAAIQSASLSMPASLKQAWANYAKRHGLTLPRTDSGGISLDANASKLSGLTDTPAWEHWSKLQAIKKRIGMLCEYEDVSKVDDPSQPDWARLRPLIGINTSTMRCSSQVPNSQNMPSQGGFRNIIKARPAHKILSVDFAAIELRIAAALALRAVKEAEDAISGKLQVKRYVRDGLIEATSGPIERPCPPSPMEAKDEDRPAAWAAYYQWFAAKAYRQVLEHGTPMAEVFRRDVDIHLLTAVSILAKDGRFDTKGKSPLDFMAGLSHEESEALKKQLKSERQSSKALSFGLLYGMSAAGLHAYGITGYGLSWTLEEATKSREDWFAVYVEVAFWQLWVRLTKKLDRRTAYYRDWVTGKDGEQVSRLVTRPLQLYKVHTLGNRPIVTASLIEALNYQDQGGGSEMLLKAIVSLPEPAKSCFINAIHDEMLLEVPEHQLELVTNQVRTAMLEASRTFLDPWGIPSAASEEVGDTWIH